MSDHIQDLIDGHLDGILTPRQEDALARWLCAKPENASRFASDVMLHDRLHTVFSASPVTTPSPHVVAARIRRRSGPFTAAVGLAFVIAIFIAVGSVSMRSQPVSAGVVELERIIATQTGLLGSSYRIFVEAKRSWKETRRKPRPESSRPPKPPLDLAVVHASGRQFVLLRTDRNGLPFITGRNNTSSWAISPDGPVRVSRDLDRFHHDVPGHEHDFPLTCLTDGLSLLRRSYELRLDQQSTPERSKLVAERRPGHRGPRTVEIVYDGASGVIESLRFFDMPYGPDRLDLRMELLETPAFTPDFFDHTTHHKPDRTVLEE